MPKKVLVALSGGVDSSVAAFLQKKAGFEVEGIHFNFCSNKIAVKRAKEAAKALGIPLKVLDARKDFQKKIIQPFLKSYQTGQTPNPCVFCNQSMKFRLLFEEAKKRKADFVATGHYAISRGGKLFKAKDKQKDQSYFLWKIKDFSKIVFPNGKYTKPEVRKIAREANLPTAFHPESQEVCFIKDSTARFLEKKLARRKGKIISEGKVLGEHQGLWFYTLGQRKGIGLPGGPFYVAQKDFKTNVLIVSKNKKDLQEKEVFFKEANFRVKSFPFQAKARIRHRGKLESCLVFQEKAVFLKPKEVVAAGQSIVFYQGEELVGGGVVKEKPRT